MDLIKLQPVYKDYLWGGNTLKEKFNKHSSLDVVAESWELSVHKDGNSTVVGTDLTLLEFLNQHPGFLGKNVDSLPILIKLIDAKDSLSIQVHPDEAYANKNENDHGKTEMWYIVDASEDSYIYYGVNRSLSKQEFEQSIKDNTVLDNLRKVPVKKGDYFLIEAGTIHAIGAGILIYEVQQSSNATYRVYDFNRKDKNGNTRELHIQKAVDVAKLEPVNLSEDHNVNGKDTLMVDCDLFTVSYYPVKEKLEVVTSDTSFTSISFLSGSGTISYNGEEFEYQKGDTFLAKADNSKLEISGNGEIICSKVKCL